jgi:DNA-binding NarL/FixJ family response regulator
MQTSWRQEADKSRATSGVDILVDSQDHAHAQFIGACRMENSSVAGKQGSPRAILVIDDHPLFRDGLQPLLAQLWSDARVLVASDAPSGLALAEAHPEIGLVLIDRNLPKMSGLSAIPAFGRLLPEVPIVMISASELPSDARAALAAGARGFLPKSSRSQAIVNALRFIVDGGTYVPPMMLDDLESAGGTAGSSAVDDNGLTARQRQVLKELCAGLSNKDIACKLNLAENTVKVHVSAIFKALGVISRTQAVLAVRERNISLQDC